MAETHEGATLVLRKFASREDAEDHPVKLSLWKRVWVEQSADRQLPPEASLVLPWTIEEPHGSCFTYLRDADGTRMATLYGRQTQRDRMVAILADHGLLDTG